MKETSLQVVGGLAGTLKSISPVSYTVFPYGGFFYAQNGSTGALDFQGADASTVVNSAVAASSPGGSIQLNPGTYSLSSPIYVGSPGNVLFMGSGASTQLQLMANRPNLSNTFIIAAPGVTVSDMVLDGNKANQTNGQVGVITLAGATDLRIENVIAQNFTLDCFYFGSKAQRIWMRDCRALNANRYNLAITSASDITINGLDAYNAANQNVFIGPNFTTDNISNINFNNLNSYGCSSGYGVLIQDQNITTQGFMTFRDCKVHDNAGGYGLSMVRDVSLIGGDIYNNAGIGFGIGSLGGVINGKLIGVTARLNGGGGLRLTSSSIVNPCQNFTMADCFSYDNTGYGIQVNGNATLNFNNVTVEGCYSFDSGVGTQTYGIGCGGNISGVLVTDNHMYGNITNDLLVGGANFYNNWYGGAFHP